MPLRYLQAVSRKSNVHKLKVVGTECLYYIAIKWLGNAQLSYRIYKETVFLLAALQIYNVTDFS